jgi:SAM-dependent methyltransferase
MASDPEPTSDQPTVSPARRFYETRYALSEYAAFAAPEQHGKWHEVEDFVQRYDLQQQRCLEVGCGRGYFQDLVGDYTGLDISANVREHLHKPFVQASATALPFPDNWFDAIWTINALEHVPAPELALAEMRRVLKPGGLLLLSPAWQCRPWAAQGYPVRPYSDFDWRGKLIKASVPLRNSLAFRLLHVFPRRLARLARWLITRRPTRLSHGELTPNYEHFWMTDGDAVNSIDPLEAILWFVSRGDECLSHPSMRRQFLIRTRGITFRIRK